MGDTVAPSWTVAEVTAWLTGRKLTEAQCKEFDQLDGKDLLSLKRDDLESVLGKLKATALFNQLHQDDAKGPTRAAESTSGEGNAAKRRRVAGDAQSRHSQQPQGNGGAIEARDSRSGNTSDRSPAKPRGPPPPPAHAQLPTTEVSRDSRGRPGVAPVRGAGRPYDHLDLKILPIVRHHPMRVVAVAEPVAEPASERVSRSSVGDEPNGAENGAEDDADEEEYSAPPPPRPATAEDEDEALDYGE